MLEKEKLFFFLEIQQLPEQLPIKNTGFFIGFFKQADVQAILGRVVVLVMALAGPCPIRSLARP